MQRVIRTQGVKIMQDGNNNNNFNNSGDNNNFHFSQSQNDDKSTQLTVDPKRAKIIEKTDIRDKTVGSFLSTLAGVAITCVGLASDCFGLGEKLGIEPQHLLIATFPLAIAPALINRNAIRYFVKRPKNKNEYTYVGDGQVIGINNSHSYWVDMPKAKCIYNNCNGFIYLTATPPRELGKIAKCFVGICSVGERDHSYLVDHILNATPRVFDWRPLENKEN